MKIYLIQYSITINYFKISLLTNKGRTSPKDMDGAPACETKVYWLYLITDLKRDQMRKMQRYCTDSLLNWKVTMKVSG